MADKHYKIIVPKAGAADSQGLTVKLYEHNEIVKADSKWLSDLMAVFVENAWAIETKMDAPEDVELVRARNDDGSFIGDDPDTPENEAWVEKPKKTTKKRGRTKKKVD